MQKQELTGLTFGRWTVIGFDKIYNKHTFWKCKCECGNEKSVDAYVLKKGESQSCGCLRKETISQIKRKWENQRVRRIYDEIKARCSNKKLQSFKNYGGRGIEMCKDWNEDSTKFEKWAVENGYDDTLTIDRKDVNEGYSPENCRWVSMKVQNNNRRNNIKIRYNSKLITIAELADITGIGDSVLYTWYHAGKLKEKLKIGKFQPKTYRLNEMEMTLKEWAEKAGLSADFIRERIKRGWALEEALQPAKTKWNTRPKK